MKKSIKMLALVLSFIMVLGLMPVAQAEEAPVLAKSDDVVIYYTNDVHTYINKPLSYDNIADLKAETAKQAAGVLLVDAGDAIQGTAYGSMDKGETIIELMNAVGYDVATMGNHEFDYGMEHCLNERPILFVLTVCTAPGGDINTHGLFIGDKRNALEAAIELAQEKNIDFVETGMKKCVVYLDPSEFRTTWLGNKSVYRTSRRNDNICRYRRRREFLGGTRYTRR